MNPTTLRSETDADPRGYGYAGKLALGSDQGVADLLNLVRNDIWIWDPVPVVLVAGALQQMGVFNAIRHGATDTDQNTMFALTNPSVPELDFSNPVTSATVDALVTEGTLSSAQGAALKALGKRNGSRAEELEGSGTRATWQDVAHAYGRGLT